MNRDAALQRLSSVAGWLHSALPVLALATIALILNRTQGHYVGAEQALGLGALAVILFLRLASTREPVAVPRHLLAAALVLFAFRLRDNPLVIYAEPGIALRWLNHLLTLVAWSSAVVAAAVVFRRQQLLRPLLGLMLAGIVAAKVLVPIASPKPAIDVYANSLLAADYLRAGHNPYAATYPDIYGKESHYVSTFSYWPGTLLWILPFRLAVGDIRYAYLVADLVFAFVLFRLARRRRIDEAAAAMVCVLWLVLPVTLFEEEQSWTDSLLLMLLALAATALREKRWRTAGVLLGLLAATKQYALAAAGAAVLWAAFEGGATALVAVAVPATLACAALTLPFVVANPGAFYFDTFAALASQGFRRDSLSIAAFLERRTGAAPPVFIGPAVAVGTLTALAAGLRARRRFRLEDWALGLAIFYLAFFLFARQAFCNYYYLVAGLLLLTFVLEWRPAGSTGVAQDLELARPGDSRRTIVWRWGRRAAWGLGIGTAILLLLSLDWRIPPVAPAPTVASQLHVRGALRAGAAMVSLDPPFPTPIGGYNTRGDTPFTSITDHVGARALVVEVGGRKVGFVSTEVVVLPATLRAKVLAATSDLHLDDLFIGATHTHSGLGGYWDNVLSEWIGLGAYQARIEAFLSDQLAAALRQADHGLQPARLATGRVELPRYMYNRTDRRNPVDDLLTAVRVATPEGKPIASVVVFGVHATFLSWHDMRLSGDWPGSLMRELELGGAPALFFQGAGGDSTWTDIPDQKPGLERWIRFGQAIAEDTRAALAPAQDSPPEITLDLARVRVPLPKTDVGGAVPWPFNRAASNVFSWFAGAGTTNVSYLRLGPVTFANVPSEVVASVGIPWRKSLGDATLVTLMDDYVGYVERPEFITGHAGEAQRSYFGPTLAAELLKGLELARKQALSPTP